MEIDVPIIENPTKSNKKHKGLAPRKKAMLEALGKTLGIVYGASQKVGINPCTHWEWMKTDPEYKRLVDELENKKCDVIETAFLNLVDEKNPQAVIHAVKTKLKHRGYGEESTVNNNVNGGGFKLIIEDGSKMETKSEAKTSV